MGDSTGQDWTVYNETGVPDGPLHALTDLKIEEVENQKPKVSLRQKSYRYGALVHKIFVEDVRQDVDWMGRLSAAISGKCFGAPGQPPSDSTGRGQWNP